MYLYNLNIDLFIYLKNNDYLIKKKKDFEIWFIEVHLNNIILFKESFSKTKKKEL